MSNIFIGLKKTCLGVLDTGERDKDIETGLTEEGVIEMSTTVLHSRSAPSLCNVFLLTSICRAEIQDLLFVPLLCLIRISILQKSLQLFLF